MIRHNKVPPNHPESDGFAPPIALVEGLRTANRLRLFDPNSKATYDVDLNVGRLMISRNDRPSREVWRYRTGSAHQSAVAASWFTFAPKQPKPDAPPFKKRHFFFARQEGTIEIWAETDEAGHEVALYEAKRDRIDGQRMSRTLVLVKRAPRQYDGSAYVVLGENGAGDMVLGFGPTPALAAHVKPGNVVMSHRPCAMQVRKVLLGQHPGSEPEHLLGCVGAGKWRLMHLQTHEILRSYSTVSAGAARLVLKNDASGKEIEIDFEAGTVRNLASARPEAADRRIAAVCDYGAFMSVDPVFHEMICRETVTSLRMRAPGSRPGTPWTLDLTRRKGSEWLELTAGSRPKPGLGTLIVRAQTETRIYLQKGSAPHWACIDLEARKVFVEDLTLAPTSRGFQPHGEIDQARNLLTAPRVNEVRFSQPDAPDGVLKQVGFSVWAEIRAKGNEAVRYFDELARTDREILLFDRQRHFFLHVVYHFSNQYGRTALEGKIYARNDLPIAWFSTEPTSMGWSQASSFKPVFLGGGEPTGKDAAAHWSRVQPSGFDHGATCTVTAVARRPETWRKVNRITERSVFTSEPVILQDLPAEMRDHARERIRNETPKQRQPDCGAVVDLPVFRTTISLPPETRFVDIFAEAQTHVLVRGRWRRIDAQVPLRVFVEGVGKLAVSVLAARLGCPALLLRTNLMKPHERHNVLPDAPLLQKLQQMSHEEIAAALHAAGSGAPVDQRPKADEATAIAWAVKHLADITVHSYNETPHGVHHGRAVYPERVKQPPVSLGFSADRRGVQPMSPEEATARIRSARYHPLHTPQQGFTDWLGAKIDKAASILISTVEGVGTEVVKAVETAAKDTVETFEKVGEDLVHGDFADAFDHLVQGGELVAGDLAYGVVGSGGQILEGLKKTVVLVLEVAGEVISFAIDTVPFLKDVLNWIVERLGKVAGAFLRQFLDEFGWDEVVDVQKKIKRRLSDGLDHVASVVGEVKTRTDDFLGGIKMGMDNGLQAAMPVSMAQQQTDNGIVHPKHSDAIAWVEWLMSKYYDHIAHPNPIAEKTMEILHPEMASPMTEIEAMFREEMNKEGGFRSKLDTALDQLISIFDDVTRAGERVLAALFTVLQGLADVALDIVTKVVDTLLDLMQSLVQQFHDIVTTPWNIPVLSDFYRELFEDDLSLLSLASTLVAIPIAVIRKFEGATRPFMTVTPAQTPDDRRELSTDLALTYGSAHIIGSVLALFANIQGKSQQLARARARTPENRPPLPLIDDDTDEEVLALHDYVDANGLPDLPDVPLQSDVQAFATASASKASFGPIDIAGATVGGLSTLMGILAQTMGTPIPYDRPYAAPGMDAYKDVLEAPNAFAHAIWWTLWLMTAKDVSFFILGTCGTFLNTPAAKTINTTGGKVFGLIDGSCGIIMYGMMAHYEHLERVKYGGLDNLFRANPVPVFRDPFDKGKYLEAVAAAHRVLKAYSELDANPDVPSHQAYSDDFILAPKSDEEAREWLENLRNYHAWAANAANGGIDNLALKHVGNYMDCLPAIGHIGFSEFFERSAQAAAFAIVTGAALDFFGHMIEGSIVINRALNDNLY